MPAALLLLRTVCAILLQFMIRMSAVLASSRHNFVTGVFGMRLSQCPVRATIDVIEGKWKPIIINALKQGTLRFGQLRRHVPEATKKVLTEQLRELEEDRIIGRRPSG